MKRVLHELMIDNGHQYIHVQTLNEAYEALKENNVDVVITAIEIKGGTASDLLIKVKELCPGTKIIVLTSTEKEEMRRNLLSQGLYDYILKNQLPNGLLSALERIDSAS